MLIGIPGDPHLQEKEPRYRKAGYLDIALGKLKYIADRNDYVIIPGDLFSSCINSIGFFNKVFLFFNNYKGKFKVLPGNHDLLNRNIKALDKTTLGSLVYTGAVDLVLEPFDIDGTTFATSIVDINVKKIPIDKDNENVLIGHNYYGNNAQDKESFFREDFKLLNYKHVLLGHDHQPYDEMFIENSILLRPGSLMRTTKDPYNKDREIYYYQYDTEIREFNRKKVPYLNSSEVFHEGAFAENKKYIPDLNFAKMADTLKRFKKNIAGEISVDQGFIKRGALPKHRDIAKEIHEQGNVKYY